MTFMFLDLKGTSQSHLALPLSIYHCRHLWFSSTQSFLVRMMLHIHELPSTFLVSFACSLNIGTLSFSLNNFIYSLYASDS